MFVSKSFTKPKSKFVLNMAGLGGTLFLFLIFGFNVVNLLSTLDFTERFESPSSNTSNFCIDIQPKILSTGEKNFLIWFHKSLRENASKRASEEFPRAFFMKKLTWNNALAKMATEWAVECSDTRDLTLDDLIGQFTTVSVGNSDKVKLKDLLRTWKVGLSKLTPDIIAKYREPERDENDYRLLTQILWWKTKHFGCGRSVYKQKCVNNNCTEPKTVVKLVCNYFPKGNKPGEPVYFSEDNKNLICNYESDNSYCTSEEFVKSKEKEILAGQKCTEEEKERIAVEYRTRNRMIELWPAAGSQVNTWQTFNIKFFHLCVTLSTLSNLNDIINLLKLI